ncbi:hypothetical protein FUSO3_05675 [Fusobacterium necrophorum BL]|uniref:Uncharacterized protein n=1 Tax=Fusobacterium necrophorum BL TaxID=1441732 RepID=A0AB73BWA2_9FUSO|nr:hypothetical protein FUSO3_05675 [Fusobacterium necrophorum BL]
MVMEYKQRQMQSVFPLPNRRGIRMELLTKMEDLSM